MWWTGWLIGTEPSPALLGIADMTIGRNFGPTHIPAPKFEMWHLVRYLLTFFAIAFDQFTKLFEHYSQYQWHRCDTSGVQIILSIDQTRSQKGFSYAMEGAVTRLGLGSTGSRSGQE